MKTDPDPTDSDPRQLDWASPCALQAEITGIQSSISYLLLSLYQRENWISRDFFCAEQFCKSCFFTGSFCQPSILRRINHNHSQLLKASQPLRQGILFLLAADIIQDPKEILKAFSFFPKYCADSQINLTFNLWSGLCPLVCMMSAYF